MAGARAWTLASNDLLGKSLEDESINSSESSNIRALQEEMKDSEEKGDDEEAKGDDPVVDINRKGLEPCEEGKDGCELKKSSRFAFGTIQKL